METKIIEIGKRVQVVHGRKVAQGTEGIVFWSGFGRTAWRVGFMTDSGEKVYIDIDRVAIMA